MSKLPLCSTEHIFVIIICTAFYKREFQWFH